MIPAPAIGGDACTSSSCISPSPSPLGVPASARVAVASNATIASATASGRKQPPVRVSGRMICVGIDVSPLPRGPFP